MVGVARPTAPPPGGGGGVRVFCNGGNMRAEGSLVRLPDRKGVFQLASFGFFFRNGGETRGRHRTPPDRSSAGPANQRLGEKYLPAMEPREIRRRVSASERPKPLNPGGPAQQEPEVLGLQRSEHHQAPDNSVGRELYPVQGLPAGGPPPPALASPAPPPPRPQEGRACRPSGGPCAARRPRPRGSRGGRVCRSPPGSARTRGCSAPAGRPRWSAPGRWAPAAGWRGAWT